jgi:hypothetical protein
MTKKKQLIVVLSGIIISLGLSISTQSLLADWASPSSVPPNPIVPPPINTSTDDQTKTGSLNVDNDLDVLNHFSASVKGFYVDADHNNVGVFLSGAEMPDPNYKLEVKGSFNAKSGLIIQSNNGVPTLSEPGRFWVQVP